jgi:hypothetical protein
LQIMCDEIEHEMRLKREIEIQRNKELEEQKLNQLTEVVNNFGTDIQKKKWVAGMMERKEALEILWKNTFSHDTAFETGDCLSEKLNPGTEYDGHKLFDITVLSDEEFESVEHLKSNYPDFDVKLMKEVCECEDEENSIVVFARISKKIGEYTMKADFVL